MKIMEKMLLASLLAFLNTSVMAEWTKVIENSELILYADSATIRKNGDKLKIWTLKDFKNPQTNGEDNYRSAKTQIEYECNEEQFRSVAFVWFSENMGGGKVLSSDSDPNRPWRPLTPGSIGQILSRKVCEGYRHAPITGGADSMEGNRPAWQ